MIKTLDKRIVYQNDYATVRDDVVEFEDGSRGTYFLTRWNAPYGVAIAPIRDGKVLLIETYRYPDQRYSFEVPQGFAEPDLSVIENAERELIEETNLTASQWRKVGAVGGSYCTEMFVADIAEGQRVSMERKETSESIRRHEWVPIDKDPEDVIARLEIYDWVTQLFLYKLHAGR